MTTTSKIEWTEQTWNPTVGCTKISPGCKHCYAEAMAKRLNAMGTPGYENGFVLTLLPERLNDPIKRKKPTVYFVNSMSDLFHDRVPDAYIGKVFEVIAQTPQHTYQILTKRAARMQLDTGVIQVVELFQKRSKACRCRIGSSRTRATRCLDRGTDIRRCCGCLVRHCVHAPNVAIAKEYD